MAKYSLVGVDGNAFAVVCYVRKAMRECGLSKDEIDAFDKEIKYSDYNHLLVKSIEMVDFLNDEFGDGNDDEDEEYDDYEDYC